MNQTYTVKPGDTLYGISNQYGVSVTELAELNGIKGSSLGVGTVLKIPVNSGTNPNNMFMYTVQKGDTLYSIATKYKTTPEKIINLNYLGKYRKDIENKINALNENKIKELLSQDSNFVKDISSIKLNENKVEMSQNVLNKSIQRVVNKVREETLIKNKEIIHQEPVIDKDKEINFINPYEIFNINKEEIESSLDKDLKFSRGRNTNPYGDATITEKYKKLKELNPSNKKTLLLSYYMIFNIEKCESFSRNEFYIKNKDQFYYVIMGDLENLKKIYEADKYIIETKDNYYRNLLHYAVIGEYYEI